MRPARSTEGAPRLALLAAQRPLALAALAAVGLCLSSCGASGRSVAAVCKVWDTEGLALHEKFERADVATKGHGGTALISAVVSLIGAPNDLAVLMKKMGAVAPTSDAPDFESVAQAFKKLSESEGTALSDPFAAIGGSLLASLSASGSFTRVDDFLASNCGIPKS